MRIEKRELAKKIGQLKSIVPSRTTIEALKGVLYKDGYLIASNMELTVKAKLEVLDGESDGIQPFIIPDKAFDLINSLPMGDLDITVNKDVVVFKMGKIMNQFKTLPADQFVFSRESITADATATMPFAKFKTAVTHVIYAVSSSASNPIMNGLYLYCNNGKLELTGLDGHRVAWDVMLYNGDFKLLVPKSALENLLRLDIEGDISIFHDANGALFKSEDYEVYTRLIAGDYYKYQQMLKDGESYTVIERVPFMDAIKRAKLCGTATETAPVVLDIKDRSIHISYKSSMSNYEEDVPTAEDIDNPLRIGFNPNLLIDSLKVFECDNIRIEFTGPAAPVLIRAEDSDMTAVILPVKIK